MKIYALVIVVMLVMACATSSPKPVMGPPGPQGLSGSSGAIGVPGPPALQWVDGLGIFQPNLVLGPAGALLYKDESGYFWRAGKTLLPIATAVSPGIYFGSTDCSGEGYVPDTATSIYARYIFTVSTDTAYHVIPDNPAYESFTAGSRSFGGSCSPDNTQVTGVPLSVTLPNPPVTMPVWTYVMPLHMQIPTPEPSPSPIPSIVPSPTPTPT